MRPDTPLRKSVCGAVLYSQPSPVLFRCSLILLLQGIPYVFHRIFLQNGLQYQTINGLEQIVLSLEIFQLLIFISLLLNPTNVGSSCYSSNPCLYQVLIFFGTQKNSPSSFSNGHCGHQTLELQVVQSYSRIPCL